jgi:hypothetical protein
MCEDGNRFVKLSICAMKYLHHGLWMWLSENPDQNKEDWPDWLNFYDQDEDGYDYEIFEGELDDIANCFGCAAAAKILERTRSEDCRYCLIKWPTKCPCYFDDTLYDKWKFYSSWVYRSGLAKEIANLPLSPYWQERFDKEMSEAKRVVVNGMEYLVLDETKNHYICTPLSTKEGYSWFSKELISEPA